MLVYGSSFLLIMWADIIMLGYYATEKDIGIYSASQRIAGLTSMVLVAIIVHIGLGKCASTSLQI